MTKCENPYEYLQSLPAIARFTNDATEACLGEATTERKDFRFGNKEKGEPTVVPTVTPLCTNCANRWDDNASEGAAEAMGS